MVSGFGPWCSEFRVKFGNQALGPQASRLGFREFSGPKLPGTGCRLYSRLHSACFRRLAGDSSGLKEFGELLSATFSEIVNILRETQK